MKHFLKSKKNFYRKNYSNDLKIMFLGTSSKVPTTTRNVTSILFKVSQKESWMFDCGDGTQRQLTLKPTDFPPIKKIFITHLHGDHFLGIVGMVFDCLNDLPPTQQIILEIYGPKGIKDFIYQTMKIQRSIYTFDYFEVYEFANVDEDSFKKDTNLIYPKNNIYEIYSNDEISIQACPIIHSIKCFGYVIERKNKLIFDPAKAKDLGLYPGSYRHLFNGKSVQTIKGITVHPSDVLVSDEKKKKVIILGDTCNPYSLKDIGMDADLLIHEATFESCQREKALLFKHSTPEMAGEVARDFNVKHLILTHFSSRYSEDEINIKLSKEAIDAYGSNNVTCAKDFMEIIL